MRTNHTKLNRFDFLHSEGEKKYNDAIDRISQRIDTLEKQGQKIRFKTVIEHQKSTISHKIRPITDLTHIIPLIDADMELETIDNITNDLSLIMFGSDFDDLGGSPSTSTITVGNKSLMLEFMELLMHFCVYFISNPIPNDNKLEKHIIEIKNLLIEFAKISAKYSKGQAELSLRSAGTLLWMATHCKLNNAISESASIYRTKMDSNSFYYDSVSYQFSEFFSVIDWYSKRLEDDYMI